MQEGEERMEQYCLKKVSTQHCISKATNSHSGPQFGITITNKSQSQWMIDSSLFACFCKEKGFVIIETYSCLIKMTFGDKCGDVIPSGAER